MAEWATFQRAQRHLQRVNILCNAKEFTGKHQLLPVILAVGQYSQYANNHTHWERRIRSTLTEIFQTVGDVWTQMHASMSADHVERF